jgi:hypothetical protein
MLFAFGPEDLERLAIPIGIAVAVIVVLAVPALRRDLTKSYESGKSFRQKHKVAAYALDTVGVLLIVAVVVYFVFYR